VTRSSTQATKRVCKTCGRPKGREKVRARREAQRALCPPPIPLSASVRAHARAHPGLSTSERAQILSSDLGRLVTARQVNKAIKTAKADAP